MWRVFAANAAVVGGALAVLASTPLTVSWPGNLRSGAALTLLIIGTTALQAAISRRLLGPLGALWQHMQTVDPLSPGQRIALTARSVEVADLVAAFNDMLDRLEAERRLSARRTEEAQQAERRWLALELHDQIGQDLTALLLTLGLARRHGDGAQAEAIDRAIDITQECLTRVRAVVDHLRPAGLDELGLVSAVADLCDRVAAAGLRSVQRIVDPKVPRLTPEAEHAVFRIAQESLTNVLRHADATEAQLTLTRHAGGVRLRVRDDGVGPPPDPDALAEGSGIRGMRERALLLGATFQIGPHPAGGTVVRLDVPASEAVPGSRLGETSP